MSGTGDRSSPVPFANLWAATVADGPDRSFLRFAGSDGEVTEWTYGDFDGVVGRAAAFLAARGVGRGHAVHLALGNSPVFVALWLAAMRLGAWIVPSDPEGTAGELAEHIGRVRPTVGVCAHSGAGRYREAVAVAAESAPDLSVTVCPVDEADVSLAVFGSAEAPPQAEVTQRTRAAVMFTSGTSGRPKGVVVTQANYTFAGRTMADAAGLRAEHRFLVVLPLFHANAQYYCFAAVIAAGASVALEPRFSASGFLGQVRRHGATHLSLFAAPIRMILAKTPPGTAGSVDVVHCWYAMRVGGDNYERFAGLIGCRPRQLYGMTETVAAVLTDRRAVPDDSTIGSATPGCRVAVGGDDGVPVGPDVEGEILVGGEPGVTIFDGYLDAPDLTAASFTQGWFRTGDRGAVSGEGNFVFSGRSADILKVAGENISTVEIEAVLSAHPGVLEAAVVGAPDPVRDEVPVAFFVADDPVAPPTAVELDAWCAERLAKAKRPSRIVQVAELPRTSVGKIRKHLLTPRAG